jgi:D-ribose pyranose/furanose isomerase RbsD
MKEYNINNNHLRKILATLEHLDVLLGGKLL